MRADHSDGAPRRPSGICGCGHVRLVPVNGAHFRCVAPKQSNVHFLHLNVHQALWICSDLVCVFFSLFLCGLVLRYQVQKLFLDFQMFSVVLQILNFSGLLSGTNESGIVRDPLHRI